MFRDSNGAHKKKMGFFALCCASLGVLKRAKYFSGVGNICTYPDVDITDSSERYVGEYSYLTQDHDDELYEPRACVCSKNWGAGTCMHDGAGVSPSES